MPLRIVINGKEVTHPLAMVRERRARRHRGGA
jgi:hypothetical protein